MSSKYYVVSEYLREGPLVLCDGKRERITGAIVGFDDKQEADLYAANLRKKTFGQVIVNVGPGPLYRVEWRDRASGKTGVAASARTKSRAENIAENLDLDHPNRDHWIAVDEW
jgi:hypothetical protein